MKLVIIRKQPDRSIMYVAFLIAIFPAIFLLTGNAILVGRGDSLEASLSDDPDSYWYIIHFYLALVIGFVALSLLDFPFIKSKYDRILIYKSENKIISYIGFDVGNFKR